MIRSMTGYGTAQVSSNGWTVTVDCRSVNQKALEVKTYVPRSLAALESALVESVKHSAQRGRVDVRVEMAREAGPLSLGINAVRFAEVAAHLGALAKTNGLAAPMVADVLSVRDVVGGVEASEQPDADVVLASAREALQQLVGAREEEGRKLRVKMNEYLSAILADVDVVESLRATVLDEYRTKLETRVREALAKFEAGEFDEQRVLGEVVLYADRSDVAEEIQRARSHVDKLGGLLDTASDEPCGKRIDFYLQELFREANTMGSKSSAVALTDAVVRIKSTIEQMREQAANIE